jgi:hypothetical protein
VSDTCRPRPPSLALAGGCVLAALSLMLGQGCGGSAAPNPGADCRSVADTTQPATVSYATQIVPLFFPDKYNCLEAGCHGGGLASSNYSLASHSEMLKAGDEAKQLDMCAVKPGDPEASYLVWKVEGRKGILMQRMPLGCVNNCVSAADDTLLRTWIEEGARDN